MAFTSCTVTVTNISTLSDTPNTLDGLSGSALRARFDLTGSDLKNYINTSLVTILNSINSGSSGAENIGSATITGITGNTIWSQVNNLNSTLNSSTAGSSGAEKIGSASIGSLGTTVWNQINTLNTNVTNLNSTKLNLSGGTLTGALVLTAATASLPALTTTGDTDTGIYFPAANNISVTTGGTQRIVVDNTNTTLSNILKLTTGSVSAPSLSASGDNAGIYFPSNNIIALSTASTERMRINGVGNTGIGTSSPSSTLHVAGTITYSSRPTAGTGTSLVVDTSNIIKELTSSIRFKENINLYTKGLNDVLKLNAVTYNYKGENIINAGFIAEEVDNIGLSEFVVKDNENKAYSIPYGNMVALLTNAIKEQQTIIDSLNQRIESLEGKVI